MDGLVPFSQLWKVTFASSETIADDSSTDEAMPSPVLSATQESDHGLYWPITPGSSGTESSTPLLSILPEWFPCRAVFS